MFFFSFDAFYSLYTFHHKTVALADDYHPFKQHDLPNKDNSSLPWIQGSVTQLFLIPLYLGYGIAIQYKVFVAGIIDRSIQESSVVAYTTSTFHLNKRGTSNHVLYRL